MARIAGVNVPDNKKIPFALRYVKGIGPTISYRICEALNLDVNAKMETLDEGKLIEIREYVEKENILIEGSLDAETRRNIKRLMDMKSYRGLRHRRGLPVRGQRTSTNARTRKGPAIAIAGKKK